MNLINKLSTKKYVTLLLVIFVPGLAFMNFGPTGRLEELSGHMGTLDMMHSYSGQLAYNLLDMLGGSGRMLYRAYLGLDLIFIIVFGLLQLILISFLVNKAKLSPKWQMINLLPLARAVFDFLENILIFAMLVNYPAKLNLLAGTASIVTSLKWLTMAVMVIGIIVLIALAVINNRKEGETV